MEQEHHAPADHVAEYPVGLPPVPGLTEEFRETPSAHAGVVCDQLPDEGNVRLGDDPAAVFE